VKNLIKNKVLNPLNFKSICLKVQDKVNNFLFKKLNIFKIEFLKKNKFMKN